MGREFGDEEGMWWSDPVHVGRSAANGAQGPRPDHFRRATPPDGYRVPDHFPDISRAPRIFLDLESKDKDLKTKGPGWYRDAFIAGAAVCTDEWAGEYYPVAHRDAPNCDPEKVFRWLRDQLKDFRGELVGAHIMYDLEGLRVRHNVEAPHAALRDVLYAEPLLDENQYKYNLELCSQKYLHTGKVTHELVRLYGEDYIKHMDEVHPGHAAAYALGDVHNTADVYDQQIPLLEGEGLADLFELECRLIPLLLDMREVGVRVDIAAAERMQETLDLKHKEMMLRIRNAAGFEVNVNASDSIAKAFDKLGLTYPRTAPTKGKPNGSPSFVVQWLEHHPHEIAQWIVAARKYAKFKSTFIEGYILDGHDNGLLRGQFHPLRSSEYGTVTGRFSSSNPNLQNIPVRDEVLGPLVRGLFIPLEGHRWWSKDYSQIEYRFLIHYAVLARCVGADVAQRMYQNDPTTDYHQMTADIIGWAGKAGRKRAKNINFGLVYGMGIDKLAASIGLSRNEAQPVLDEYHTQTPYSKQLYNMAASRANDAGFVRTVLNRKRRFNMWESKKFFAAGEERPEPLPYEAAVAQYGEANVKRAGSHKALNAVLQGSAADLVKLAMVTLKEAGLVGRGGLPLHLTVHDELDGSENGSAEHAKMLKDVHEIMTHVLPLKVPVLAEGGSGPNWSEAK